jgi:hypothetical protein
MHFASDLFLYDSVSHAAITQLAAVSGDASINSFNSSNYFAEE